MSRVLTLSAKAKLNMALDITGKRKDGYHDMHMIMQTVDLCDTVVLREIPEGISLSCDDPSIPCDEKNIAWKAAEAFFAATHSKGGVAITLYKRIPHEAGLAGGSADAAAVLQGLNQLYGCSLSVSQLCQIGEKLGADVPFCVVGRTAEVKGIGEKITPLPCFPDCFLVIVKPQEGISTKMAFSAIDQKEELIHPQISSMVQAINDHNLERIAALLFNVFEQVCTVEEVFDIKRQLCSMGALNALMSGSGSAVFGLFSSEKQANVCAEEMKKRYSQVFVTKPVF